MKGRLNQLSLAAPELTVAKHQPFTGDTFELREDDAFAEVAMVLLQHVLDVVRVEEHVTPPVSRNAVTDLDRVTVLSPVTRDCRDGIAPHFHHEGEGGSILRPRS